MALKAVSQEAVRGLMAKLKESMRVVAPHRREGRNQWEFSDVEDPAKVSLEYTSTILPPKKYAFPTQDVLVHYKLGEKFEAEAVLQAEPIALFGVHPCDIYALECLDISMTDQYADPNWVERRKAMRIIGVDCQPDEWCFCASMKTATVSSGYDLFLTPINDWTEFVADAATAEGEEMLAMIDSREATSEDLAQVRAWQSNKVAAQRERHINTDINDLPLHFTGFADSEVWQRWADKCYSCGTCNITCPTCFCFDVLDQIKLTLDEGYRTRVWDGCMLEDFALVAPHENFREERSERIRHRFYRKYAYLFTRYGRAYCCGCGRCARQCLADIDPVTVINELLAEARKEKEGAPHGA
ncbi:MAG: 4Fe-4S dicluster domain-containing protein [Armatimonadetes bacterium]|nr:4Fe-4S dicluster domain-containing protein [Armatimonadota bacterium]